MQAVLAARIDRLSERDKRLLQVASVIGREVPEPLLADVAELPAPELADALASLQRGEFLLHLAVHLGYHLGQVDCHRRTVTETRRSVRALNVRDLSTASTDSGD